MKKKFLIPVLGLFTMALAFSFNNNSSSSSEELNGLFVESDNIAFAENPTHDCGTWTNRYCIKGDVVIYNQYLFKC